MNKLPIITLRNLMISGAKCIGLQYYPTKVIDIVVGGLKFKPAIWHRSIFSFKLVV